MSLQKYELANIRSSSPEVGLNNKNDAEKGFESVSMLGSGLEPIDGLERTSKIWTRPAKMFFLCISAFVVSTIGMLIALEVGNIATFGADIGSPLFLQPQSMISELFLLVVAYFAFRSRNMIHIIAVLCFNVFLVLSGLIEAILRHSNLVKSSSRPGLILVWALPVVDLAFHVGCDWAAWKLYRELGWYAYKKVSGDLRLRRLYYNYLILSTLLLFSVYLQLVQSWSIGYLVFLVVGMGSIQILTNKTVPVITVFVLMWILYLVGIIVSFRAVKKESRRLLRVGFGLQGFYILWCVGEIALFGAEIERYDTYLRPLVGAGTRSIMKDTVALPGRTIFQILVGFPLAVATLVYTILVGRGFGNGLKEIYPTAAILRSEQIDLSID